MEKERGFCSVSLMLLLGVAMVMGGFFIFLAQCEMETAENFYEGIAAENLAQAGIYDVLVKLSKNTVFKEDLLQWEKGALTFVSGARIKEGRYTVYLTYKGQQPLLLSIGEYRGAKRQAVVSLSAGPGKAAVMNDCDK